MPDISEFADWATVAGVLVALLAVLVPFFYTRKQDIRRENASLPQLVANLVEGRVRREQSRRVYELQFTVRNLSDSSNAIADAELRISYNIRDERELLLRLPSVELGLAGNSVCPVLHLPILIPSKATVRGTLAFVLDEAVLGQKHIDRYQAILTDTHGIETIIEPISLREHGQHEA